MSTATLASTEAATAAPPTHALVTPDLSAQRLAALTVELASHAGEVDATGDFPWAGLQAVHDAGLLTVTVPPEHGGRGLSGVEAVTVFEALGQGDPSVALLAAMTTLIQPVAARMFSPPRYQRLLRESASGPTLLNAIRAEPELGAPARGGLPATTLRRTSSGWVLDGRKAYATGSEGLAYHLVWAVTDEAEPRVGHVVVPARGIDGTPTPGLEIVRTWDHLGMRGTSTHDVVYAGVAVDIDDFAGAPVGSAPNNPAPTDGLFLALPALYLGIARAAQAAFTDFARERVPAALGRPIATTDRIKTAAGEIEATLVGAEEVLLSLARRIDDGEPGALARASVAKLLVTRAAIGAVEHAVAVGGNPVLSRRHPLQRHLRDVLCARIHPPQDDTALLAIGARALAR